MRVISSAVLVAAAVLALTGCGSQASEPTASPSITIAPTTTAPPASPSASATTSTPPTAAPSVPATAEPTAAPVETGGGAPAGQCSDDALGIQIMPSPDGGGAGSEYYRILFINTGGTSCVLRGTPGVSVVGDGSGKQLGKPADRIQTGVRSVRLAVGSSAVAQLKVVNIGTDGGPLDGCTVQKGDGYRVYPPHSKQSIFVKDPSAVACVRGPSFMTVSPVMRRTD